MLTANEIRAYSKECKRKFNLKKELRKIEKDIKSTARNGFNYTWMYYNIKDYNEEDIMYLCKLLRDDYGYTVEKPSSHYGEYEIHISW